MFAVAPGKRMDLYVEAGPGEREPPIRDRFVDAIGGARRIVREIKDRGARVTAADGAFGAWLEQSRADVAVLTTALSTGLYPYAGIPWFSTPFGRDGIITAWQMLWLDPSLAKGVLTYLAGRQATAMSAFGDAAPGKIMHETRRGEMAALKEIPFGLYYGGVDTTPLFVALAGAYLWVSGLANPGEARIEAAMGPRLAEGAASAEAARALYRRLYGASALDQVLFTLGLTFMAMAAATWLWGAGEQPVALPAFLRGQVRMAGLELGRYRLFLVALVVVVTLALHALIQRTRFGARVRAAVDNRQAAAGLGIPVDRLFTLMFALGTGLAGLGGALGIDVLGLDPAFALKYLVYFLLVVAVGGAGTISGAALAAMILGICDVAGKYYLPQLGAFIIYFLMVVLLVAFPAGLHGRRA